MKALQPSWRTSIGSMTTVFCVLISCEGGFHQEAARGDSNIRISAHCDNWMRLWMESGLRTESHYECERKDTSNACTTADLSLRLRGGRWGRGMSKRRHEDVFDDDGDIPTFSFVNPSDDHPQIPFARKEGKVVEYEFPEGMTEEDDAEKLGDDRASRAERRRRARERGGQEFAEEADPGVDTTGPSSETRPLKQQFLDMLSEEELQTFQDFMENQQKHHPGWDWRDLTWAELERYYNATDESTRTDDFPLLPRDKAEALEREFEAVERKMPYLPDRLSISPIPRIITWWHSGIGQHGLMWDVRARGQGVVVRKIHAGSCSGRGPVAYTLWTTTGQWRYKCHAQRMWQQIGGGTLDLPQEKGEYGEIPLSVGGVEIRAGSTQAFYLHSAEDEDGVALRTWPLEAVDDGPHCAVGSAEYDEEAGTTAIDGTAYRLEPAPAGGVVDRNEHLLVLRGVISPERTPFANISELEAPVAWCGMIDYELSNHSLAPSAAPGPLPHTPTRTR